jgi:hypothetical protein
MRARSLRRARAAARRRRDRRPHYPLSSPPRSLRATVAEPAVHRESWKALFVSLGALFRPRPAITRIVVSPMSAEWLKEHDATRPKHADDA